MMFLRKKMLIDKRKDVQAKQLVVLGPRPSHRLRKGRPEKQGMNSATHDGILFGCPRLPRSEAYREARYEKTRDSTSAGYETVTLFKNAQNLAPAFSRAPPPAEANGFNAIEGHDERFL
jgi:hypothetical protein